MARARIWYAALTVGMIAACGPASSPSQETKAGRSPWQPPGSISGYVLQAGEVRSQPSRFLSERSWFAAVEATEREYVYVHPETKESVDILVIQHARPKWAVREFSGLAVRLKTESVKGKVVLSVVGAQEVLNVSGVSPGAWRRYIAWPTLPDQTVVVAASHNQEPDLNPFLLDTVARSPGSSYPARARWRS